MVKFLIANDIHYLLSAGWNHVIGVFYVTDSQNHFS